MAAPWYERLLGRYARLAGRFCVWYRWPFPLAMAALLGQRANMREHNLFDTETAPLPVAPQPSVDVRTQRTADGAYNDLGTPWMGACGTRFGRNVPITE